MVATFSDVQGGWAGAGNINADPLFIRNPSTVLNGDGTVNTALSDFGDLRLRSGSPCVDVGSSAAITSPPFPKDPTNTFIVDLEGSRRPRAGGSKQAS